MGNTANCTGLKERPQRYNLNNLFKREEEAEGRVAQGLRGIRSDYQGESTELLHRN